MELHFGAAEITVVAGLLSAVVLALVTVFKLLMLAKDAAITDAKNEAKDAKAIATDAVKMMEAAIDAKRITEGKLPLDKVAAVVPEHHSPVTPEQQATADQATLRASVTAAALELGLPPRTAEDPLPGDERLVSKAEAVQAVLRLPDKHETPPAEEKP